MHTTSRNFCNLIVILQFHLLLPFINSSQPLLGIHPLDEKYYASELIKCKDGSKTFSKDRLNDDFCDCVDGTDEPGTSACPRGKFYCRNAGSTPQFLFSSRVNDQICDCCDGSDEYGTGISCPITCVMGGNLEYKAGNIERNAGNHKSFIGEKESKIALEDLLQKTTGLKIAIIIQIALLGFMVAFRVCRRIRLKRRRLI